LSRNIDQKRKPTLSAWKIISNHATALYLINKNPASPARQLAVKLDISERSVRRIIKDLQTAGYLRIQKEGRSNRYKIFHSAPLRRTDFGNKTVGELLEALSQE